MNSQPYIIRHYTSNKHTRSGKLNLSLFVENEVFMFALFTQDFRGLVELGNVKINAGMSYTGVSEKLGFLLSNHGLTNLKFETVNISVLNPDFTILPEAFAIKESSKDMLHFTSGHLPKNTFAHHFNNMSFNYSINGEVLQMLERTFRNASIRHAGAVSINLLFNNRSLKNCDLFLNFNEGVFELLAKKQNSLLYYNVFNYETKEDVLYYLLFMMEQFGLDPQLAKLKVAGQLEAESEIYTALKKYIKNTGMAVNEIDLSDNAADIQIPNHFYFTLFNQHLCEL